MNAGSAVSWADERDLRAGHIVGPFELLALVGRGGMARVWAGRELQSGDLFALKMLRSHLAEDATFRDMFFDEARIAASVHHQNVAHTYELLEIDGVLCLVMELVDGPSLVRIIRPGSAERDDAGRVALPPRLAARIVAEACAGLHAAHELRDESGRLLNVVHRDVSPQNVLVTGDGHVKITDFGVAKALGKINVTIAGQIKGKLAYMSPEQLTGSGIDRRSDVFAIGCLLYECTVGTRAFDGDNDPEILRAILHGEPTPPSRLVPGFPPQLEAIIMRCLAPVQEQRWATAQAVQEALEGYIAQSGPWIGPPDIAQLVSERTGVPMATPAPAPPSSGHGHQPPQQQPQQQGPMSGPQPARALPQMTSGTRRREESAPKGASWGTLIGAVCLGLVLGLIVLRFVYVARHARNAPTPTSTSAPNPNATVSPIVTAPATPIKAPPAATPEPITLDLPADVPPVISPANPANSASARPAAPRPPKAVPSASSSALPPNPYE